MRSNVRPFPTRKSDDSGWGPRLIAAAVYLFLGYALSVPTGGSLNLLMLMAILYWAFIHQRRLNTPYQLRFHLLQAMICYLFLTLSFLILRASSEFLLATGNLVGFDSIFASLQFWFDSYYSTLTLGIMLGSALVLAIGALSGKTFRIPVVTASVEHWV